MNVIVEESVWGLTGTDPLDLLALLALCADGRHLLLLDEQSRKQATVWIDAHFQSQSGIRRRVHQILEENRRKAPNASSQSARIVVTLGPTHWEQAKLELTHAVRLLQRPLKLLVENSRNDRAFLRMIAEPAARRQLDEAIQRGWIEFEMGGGIGEIRQRLRILATAALGDHTKMIERARLWVMFDRDAHRNDRSRESDDSREVREAAAQIQEPWPLAAHQLTRRSIESYVPARTLRDWWCGQAETQAQKLSRERLVNAFLTDETDGGLTEKARHSYNMKRGLLRDVEQRRQDEIRQTIGPPLSDNDLDALFRGLDPAIRHELIIGRGFTGLSEAFSVSGAISENALMREVLPDERRRMLNSLFNRM